MSFTTGLSYLDPVDKTPAPVLVGFKGPDDRMPRLTGMLARMAVGRSIAAANMPAGETKPQVDPLAPDLQTILAPVQCRRFDVANLIEVRAFYLGGRCTAPVYCFSFHITFPRFIKESFIAPYTIILAIYREKHSLSKNSAAAEKVNSTKVS